MEEDSKPKEIQTPPKKKKKRRRRRRRFLKLHLKPQI
jgi:hypothetical protein